MLSNRTDVEKEKIYRLIKQLCPLVIQTKRSTDFCTPFLLLYSRAWTIYVLSKNFIKNFLSTDKVKRKFIYRVTKISDINESIKIFLTICRMPIRKVMFSVTLYL